MQVVQLRTVQAKTQDSAANAAQTVTITAPTNQDVIVCKVEVCNSAAAVGASGITITVKDGTTIIYKTCIAASSAIGTQKVLNFGSGILLSGALNVDVTAVGTAGGITTANVLYYIE